MFQWMIEVTTEFFNLWRELIVDFFHLEDPKKQLQNQLRAMYGRGELGRERFLELRGRLDRDQIGLGDIQLVQREALLRRRAGHPVDDLPGDREIERSLDRLYIDLGLVEEARAAVLRSQQAISEEFYEVERQGLAAREYAQAALPDEVQARAHLETWHRLAGASRQIELRGKAMSGEMQRLDEMQAELKASILRLQMLRSEENLAVLRLQVRQDLATQGKSGSVYR